MELYDLVFLFWHYHSRASEGLILRPFGSLLNPSQNLQSPKGLNVIQVSGIPSDRVTWAKLIRPYPLGSELHKYADHQTKTRKKKLEMSQGAEQGGAGGPPGMKLHPWTSRTL